MSEERGTYLAEPEAEEYTIQVRDEAAPHDYRIEIPNIVDDTHMSVYAFRLYVHFKRRAGDHGESYESTKKLAMSCGMSGSKVSESKQELKSLGLIKIRNVMDETGKAIKEQHITIVDVWSQNYLQYHPKKGTNNGGGVFAQRTGVFAW